MASEYEDSPFIFSEFFCALPAPDPDLQARAEIALWRAVITQALMDAGSESRKPEALYHKFEATAWLTGGGRDFTTVCDYAALDPRYVRRMAAQALAKGCKWRAEPETEVELC